MLLIFSSVEAQEGDNQDGSSPAKPTGLSAKAYHDHVDLNWDDPGDDTITGYRILRLQRDLHELGDFQVHVSDTGSAATTHTPETTPHHHPPAQGTGVGRGDHWVAGF